MGAAAGRRGGSGNRRRVGRAAAAPPDLGAGPRRAAHGGDEVGPAVLLAAAALVAALTVGCGSGHAAPAAHRFESGGQAPTRWVQPLGSRVRQRPYTCALSQEYQTPVRQQS